MSAPNTQTYPPKNNIVHTILSSKLLLPFILLILSISAFILFTPFAKATSTGISQIGCINCASTLIADGRDVAVDSSGNIYVLETYFNRVHKIDRDGNTVKRWGSKGSDDGQFNEPSGIAIDSSNNIYVADSENNRIQKFDNNGTFVTKWGSTEIGSYGGSASGSGNGEFYNPTDITVDSSGNVYVADTDNNRIQKFDASGTFIATWGTYGSGDGQFYYPYGIAVDSSGNIYVADTNNQRIQKFDASGTFLATWGTQGSDDGQFSDPRGITTDSSNNIYVADTNNNRIQKFDTNGTFVAKWGSSSTGPYGSIGDGEFSYPQGITIDSDGKVYVADNYGISTFSSSGAFQSRIGQSMYDMMGGSNGQFMYPYDVTTDATGNIYVDDSGNNRIQKFDSSGNFLAKWGSTAVGPYGSGSAEGSGNGEFSFPVSISHDTSGNFYVTDLGNYRIQKFDQSGNFITKWGSYGSDDGQFSQPVGIAVDASDNVYVADINNNNIQKFDANGNFITKWGSDGCNEEGVAPNSAFCYPYDISVDASNNVYVADTGNSRIQKFDASGNFLTTWGSVNDCSQEGVVPVGALCYPYGISVDASNNIYISAMNRIQKFDASGTYLSQYAGGLEGNSYPVDFPFGLHASGNGKLHVTLPNYSAVLTLCDNDVSSNGCEATAPGDGTVSVPNAVNQKPISLSQTGCGAITDTSSLTATSLPKQDTSNNYPLGLVSYTLTGCTTGGSSTVTATFAGLSTTKDAKLRKYNATTQTYTDVPGAVLSTTTLSGEPAVQAVYTLTDGGPLDQDGQANGTIVDPVGLAVAQTSANANLELTKTGAITISSTLLLGLIIGSFAYVYVDYRRHKKPLQAIDPKVQYSFRHHVKVVTFPLLRYRLKIVLDKKEPIGKKRM